MRVRRFRVTLGLIALFSVFGICSARADYQASFVQGIAAMDRGDWPEAVRWLTIAVGENPKEGGRALRISGMRFKPYLPHYYLGIAYLQSGNCELARREWSESERQGFIRLLPEFKELTKLRSQCESTDVSPVPDVATAIAPPAKVLRPTSPPLASPTIVPSRPPESLVAAASLYFRGDYAEATRGLKGRQYPDPRALAYAHLFQAAANYSLFVIGGEKEQALKDQVVGDIRECSRLRPNLRPNPKLFSPRFADFFEQNRVKSSGL